MSQLYIGTSAAFHEWSLKNAHSASASGGMARRWCHDALVATYADLFGGDNVRSPPGFHAAGEFPSHAQVLVYEAETLRVARDEVLAEIHAFLGVEPRATALPVMHVCKRKRYGTDFSGCYNGTSRVWPATRRLWDDAFRGCNARLATILGVGAPSLFRGGVT